MAIEIREYESWMKPQVAEMFSVQYNVPAEQFAKLMDDFYDHPYQQQKCIRLAAVDGNKVLGFQSFFAWPYFFDGKKAVSFQSGNSLVHPSQRGKGIFRMLLDFLSEHKEKYKIDFLVGFPINISRGSLIRNGWKNILDLEWFVRRSKPLRSFFGQENKKLEKYFSKQPRFEASVGSSSLFRLSAENDFRTWRENYSSGSSYYYHIFRADGHTAEFTLKPSRRKKSIRELTIGNIQSNSEDENFLAKALEDLTANIDKSGAAAFISIAVNPFFGFSSSAALSRTGFRKIDKKIFFAVKQFSTAFPVEDPSKWVLYRSDIDTW